MFADPTAVIKCFIDYSAPWSRSTERSPTTSFKLLFTANKSTKLRWANCVPTAPYQGLKLLVPDVANSLAKLTFAKFLVERKWVRSLSHDIVEVKKSDHSSECFVIGNYRVAGYLSVLIVFTTFNCITFGIFGRYSLGRCLISSIFCFRHNIKSMHLSGWMIPQNFPFKKF